jgi:hypothetical protein
MKNFEIQWKALKDKKDEDIPDVPKITKALPIIKWTEAFTDFLDRVIGVRTIPLCYVIREEVQVTQVAPPLANDQPHSTEHGSVEAELIARSSHQHPLFRGDNASVYHFLEEATRSTSYAASIKPFQRTKDGRGAWIALVSQFAGTDKWEAEIKRQEQLLQTRVWKGQSNFSLENFVSQHRNAFVSMQACAQHVQYQLPNEHSRVGFLLDAIQCSDAGLQAAMASVRTDNGPQGMRNNFETTASHLLPYDPVARKRIATNKRDNSLISGVEGDVSAFNANKKLGIGKTGVHFRFYKKPEYAKLTDEQKLELKEWRENNPDTVKRGQQDKHKGKETKKQLYSKKEIASLVSKKVKLALEEKASAGKEEEEASAYIMSLVEKALNKQAEQTTANTSSTTAAAPSKPSVLRSILKQAKNSKQA